MDRKYLGDILVIESEFWQGKLIKPFTGKYNHSAMRTHPNQASSVVLGGIEKYLLSYVPDKWKSYIILRHKTITDSDREKLRRFNKLLPKKYDIKLLLKLAYRQLNGVEPNEDILSRDGFDCSSRPARMYEMLGYPVVDGVDSSQIRPVHFLESKYFEVIREWERK